MSKAYPPTFDIDVSDNPFYSTANAVNNEVGERAIFREPVLLINTDQSPDLNLYDQTRFRWKQKYLGEDTTQFNVVCSTHEGKIYETYHVDSWHVIKEGDVHLHAKVRGKNLIITKENKSIANCIGCVYFDGQVDEERGKLYNGKTYKRPRGPVGPIPVNIKLSDGTYVFLFEPKGILSIWDGLNSYPVNHKSQS